MSAVEEYNKLQKKLFEIRKFYNGNESIEEDNLLDEMDIVWKQIPAEDKKLIELYMQADY